MNFFLNGGVVMAMFSFLFGCSAFGHQSPLYVKLAKQITATTAERLEKQKKLHLVGTGGEMMDDIQMMAMSFYFYSIVDADVARNLLITSVEEYLSVINTNEKIKPYLHNYPFTAKNVEVTIFFYNSDGSNISPGAISIATADKGKVIYYVDDPEKHTFKTLYEESYEEALKLVSSK